MPDVSVCVPCCLNKFVGVPENAWFHEILND